MSERRDAPRPSRRRRLIAAVRLLVIALVPLSLAKDAIAEPRQPGLAPIAVQARVLDRFSAGDPGRRIFGRLEWLGGLVLWSRDSRFGGYSSLASRDAGRALVTLSDEADWLRFTIETDAKGRPTGTIGSPETAPLLDEHGKPFEGKRLSDSESFALCRIGGRTAVFVGFEQVHRVLAYPAPGGLDDVYLAKPQPAPGIPAEITRLKLNSGLEAIACAPAGHPLGPALVLIGEEPIGTEPDHPVWIVGGPHAGRLSLRRIDGFSITDAAFLPSGDLLVLERRFRWTDGVRMRMRRIPAASLLPGRVADGEVLIEADMGSEIDNMEGLAVDRAPDGGTILTLISDDNKSSLQRTVMLRFRLQGE